ncbi:MAG: ABC transporter transmembrane domain-containing protein [Thermomicrobiales bacterium]|nr:ABC transporter transmembrane domain-containing protein [Thermomicrobiales bacterium]
MRPGLESFADHENAADQRAVARRLIGEMRPFFRQWLLVLLLVLMSAVAQAGDPWLIGRAVDDAMLTGDSRKLALLMLPLLGLYLLGALAMRGQIRVVGVIGQSLLADLRERLFSRFLRAPLRFFDRQPTGDLMSRVINDVETLNQFFSQILSQTIGSLFALTGVIIAMLLLDVRLALVSFAVIPIMLLTTSYFGRRARVVYRKARETTGDVTAGLQEEIAGVREAQAFNRTDQNISRFRARNAANRDANVQAVGVSSAFAPAIDVLSTIATAVVIAYGGYQVVQGNLKIGVLTSFVLYVQQFFRPLQMLSTMYAQVQAGLAGAERIYVMTDEPMEPADMSTATRLDDMRGEIEFRNVRFAYEPGHDVLRNVSFTVAPGQTLALVGKTGAGKTTIANLIPRFYDVDDGAVRIDGHDVREITRDSLRAGVAVVLQELFLFAGSVADNIAWADDLDAISCGHRSCRRSYRRGAVHHGTPRGLRHATRRGWRQHQSRPASTADLRARDPVRPAHPHPRRGDQQRRHTHRAPDSAGAGDTHGRTHQHRHRPPPQHNPHSRSHPRHRQRPDHRTWQPRRAAHRRRRIRRPLPPAIPRRGSRRGGGGLRRPSRLSPPLPTLGEGCRTMRLGAVLNW